MSRPPRESLLHRRHVVWLRERLTPREEGSASVRSAPALTRATASRESAPRTTERATTNLVKEPTEARAAASARKDTAEEPGRLTETEAKDAEARAAVEQEQGDDAKGPELAENVSETGRRDYAPHGTSPKTTVLATLNRTRKEFSEDGLTDWAASLTYYGLLAIFPGLIALVSILGIFGDPQTTTKALTDIVSDLAPGSAADTFAGPIESITSNKGAAGVLFVVGIATALWSASGYVGAFMRASNVIYETPEGRPFWKLRPLQLLVTLIMVLLLVAVILALVLTGPVVDAVAGPLGVGDTAVSIWNIAKWPVLVFVVLVMLGVLYYASPNVKLPKFSLITPGAIVALAVWVLASVLFAFYVANFGSYDKTYGTLGGVISLLVWLWISNIALLLGAQLNAEIERTRELKAGITDAAREIQLDARDEPKHQETT
ncbi:MAG: YhjD/YihY/BrkB family envelope integrity protein [Solirubrobacteraceae bacterium]|nr:YhjD/YihY/BrkB family envelope integrity protein [Solirubrobacteraceae bacterium]